MTTFVAHYVSLGRFWQAINEDGVHCLHAHRSEATAARCAAYLTDHANRRPTPTHGTPQGAYEHAAGYQD